MIRRSALCTLAFALSLVAQSAPKPLRVLFIGNSYTFFNNLPKQLESVAASQKEGPRFQTEVSLRGGMTLKWHWENKEAVEAIRKGGWDFVVLQEHSTLGKLVAAGTQPEINDPAQYLEYAEKFDAEIKKVGARTILYATWAREGYPEQQRRLDDAFTRAAQKLGASIVPTGLAWTVARLEQPAKSDSGLLIAGGMTVVGLLWLCGLVVFVFVSRRRGRLCSLRLRVAV